MSELTKSPAIKQGWLRALLIVIPFIIFTGIFQAIGMYVWSIISNQDFLELAQNMANASASSFAVLQIFGTVGTILLVWIFTRFIDRENFVDIGFSIKKRSKDILYGLLAGVFMMGIGSLLLYFSGNLTYDTINFNLIGLLQAVLLFIFVSINEEVFVRGYILRNMMGSMNKYIALVISSVLFMALHLLNPNLSLVAIINLFLAGILLGIGYIFTKNLWFPLALHFSWNFFQGPIFGFEVSGTNTDSLISHTIQGSELLTGGKFGLEGSLLATGLCSIAIIIFWMVYKKQDIVSANSETI
ncbi:CPBP family intramembrane metalloprotease [Labilibaculum sp. DW002]|uniref:CPBP family intramembrane metalloprotease n=1 Tax=Paralabilibaculum antarcticum TaxID=2912572 RepID=A0ABT5VYE3_9BACT|nr:type II CAAX endopeptidase family protein [Labilibaculum sp. DW002]MDE5420332.1 CPBP family intramembrane metalloprotease [Labilibaculum sp. DW002]